MATKYDLLKGRVKAVEETMYKQSDIFSDMVIMFTVLLENGVITIEELNKRREELQELKMKGVRNEETNTEDSNDDKSEEIAEGCGIQPEEAKSDESSS